MRASKHREKIRVASGSIGKVVVPPTGGAGYNQKVLDSRDF